MANIIGIQGMSPQELVFELQRGGKFVRYQWCVSALIITFKRFSDVHFIRAGESRQMKGLQWTLLSLVAGWWGIPWGPIWTIQALVVNLKGGEDLTANVARTLRLPTDAIMPPPVKAGKAMGAGSGK
jgi:hypothetical protein